MADAEAGSSAGLWLRHSSPWPAPPPGSVKARTLANLRAWAAVGPVPSGSALPESAQLQLADVPLDGMPPWLGLDRALGAWWAWRLLRLPVLLADAGTVLSLTRVDREGVFAGGRLLAGLALQLRAMARETAALPWPDQAALLEGDAEAWPHDTRAAMVRGVRSGLAAAIGAALRETLLEDPDGRLVLTGGDGGILLPFLKAEPRPPLHRPALALEAIAALRPA